MSPSQRPSGTPALTALQQAGVEYALRRYEADPIQRHGYGMMAARALGVEPDRVFKTLMVQLPDELVCAILPVGDSLDLRAVASHFGVKKATMADVAAAERATGYLVGGISPLGQRSQHPTVIDKSATNFVTIMVSAGARATNIEIAPDDLARLTDAQFAAIARD